MKLPEKATQPTMYFIGVTTTKSSIMKLFPLWAEALEIENAVLKGIDIDIHAEPQVYRDVVEFIKNDELSLGALVTTHKIDLYHAAKDLFDYLDPYATMFGELSSISKKDGKLEGYAKDPISSGLAMEDFIPENYWKDHGGELFIIGAGGSAIAICSYLLDPKNGENIPDKVVIANRSKPRLDEITRIVQEINPDVEAEYHLTPEPTQNDAILEKIKPHSVIINATGLGKDRPGSPLTDNGIFPEDSLVWELNYRGELDFMHQALRQKELKGLHIEDGWIYFIHGWTQVVAEVFHIDITGTVFDRIEQLSNEMR
ncbi:shikimate dehydrogenase family protein [Metabacillus idriensis]|uniref:shikimate dehydrogenase family protein n=1 Tax=Metabacillus idriensis TaxID=324768 RepID=UPI00174A865C|nr:shikimate dehydrogenase [Metabacillus idriensis]